MLPLIAGAVLGIGSAIFGHSQEKKQAKAVQKAALENLRLTTNDLSARSAEERDASVMAKQATDRQAEGMRGTTVAGAASSNVSGNSITALLQDITSQQSLAEGTIDRNLRMTNDQIRRSKRGAVAQAEGQIAGAPMPSIWGTALKIGSSLLGSYSAFKG